VIGKTLAIALAFLSGVFLSRLKPTANSPGPAEDLTPEKAVFIEKEVNRLFCHTLDCYDRARAEGTNVLQWLFGSIVGGLGLVGTLIKSGYPCIAAGIFAAVIAAAVSVGRLVHALKSQDVHPPGNHADRLGEMVKQDPEYRMRWREARGIDGRINTNIEHTAKLARAVDNARCAFAWFPVWGVLGFTIFYFAKPYLPPI
jgi:hypothetical protein